MKYKGLSIGSLGGLAIVMANIMNPPPALAWDTKTLPGLACQPVVGTQSGDFNRNSPAIRNIANTPRRVVCPVVRDNAFNVNGTIAVTTEIRVFNTGNQLTCSLDNTEQYGILAFFDVQSTAAMGYVVLQNDLNASEQFGHYNFLCSLPGGSSVLGYAVAEPSATDNNN